MRSPEILRKCARPSPAERTFLEGLARCQSPSDPQETRPTGTRRRCTGFMFGQNWHAPRVATARRSPRSPAVLAARADPRCEAAPRKESSRTRRSADAVQAVQH